MHLTRIAKPKPCKQMFIFYVILVCHDAQTGFLRLNSPRLLCPFSKAHKGRCRPMPLLGALGSFSRTKDQRPYFDRVGHS
jgi:hypothetical protein